MNGPWYLVIMAKKPSPGKVKTRMVPPLTHVEASSLYECLLRDTIEMVGGIEGVRGGIAYSPASAADYFRNISPPEFLLLPQPAGGLGRRLKTVSEKLFEEGAGIICLVNSDGPDLPPEYIHGAFLLLASEGADVVFGPNPDGGYYLVGMTAPADIFNGIHWSTPRVIEESLEKTEAAGLKPSLLPPWPDLDTAEDLLAALSRWRTGEINPPRNACRFLDSLFPASDIP